MDNFRHNIIYRILILKAKYENLNWSYPNVEYERYLGSLADMSDTDLWVELNTIKEKYIRGKKMKEEVNNTRDLKEGKLKERLKRLEERNKELYAEIETNVKEMRKISEELYPVKQPDMSLVKEINYYTDGDECYYIEYFYKGISIWWNYYQEGEYTISWNNDAYWYSSLEEACKTIENR